MLSGLLYWFSPARRRFMRRLGRPALASFESRLRGAGSPAAIGFFSILLRANAEWLAFALSPDGPLAKHAERAAPERIESLMASLLIYSATLFAREDLYGDDGQLLELLAKVSALSTAQVMLRRDQLRKAPRSEEWMLYTWLVRDLGGKRPGYDQELERSFGYQYLSYVGQYRPALARALGAAAGGAAR